MRSVTTADYVWGEQLGRLGNDFSLFLARLVHCKVCGPICAALQLRRLSAVRASAAHDIQLHDRPTDFILLRVNNNFVISLNWKENYRTFAAHGMDTNIPHGDLDSA
jgi:hypothetical protein